MSSPEGPTDGEVPNRSAKRRRVMDEDQQTMAMDLPFSKDELQTFPLMPQETRRAPSEDEQEDEQEQEDEEASGRRSKKRRLQQKGSPVAQHLSPETPKHFQHLERILFRSHSKTLASLRRLDEKYGDAIVVEHYQNGGGEVLHIFPENLPQMGKMEYRQFAAHW